MRDRKKTIIISGFPGTGKTSTILENEKKKKYILLDSDSRQFSWLDEAHTIRNPEFPDNYIQHILDNIGKVDFIFVSTHKDVREALHKNRLSFILVYPISDLKSEYMRRYRTRTTGLSDPEFIDLMDKKFYDFVNECELDLYAGLKLRLIEKNVSISIKFLDRLLSNVDIDTLKEIINKE